MTVCPGCATSSGAAGVYVLQSRPLSQIGKGRGDMREQAAVKIDRSIGGTDARIPSKENNQVKTEKPLFEPYKPKIRRAGTGCISKLNEHLYEGRYSPRIDGRRISRNVYAKTREECEERLAEQIRQMKKEFKK